MVNMNTVHNLVNEVAERNRDAAEVTLNYGNLIGDVTAAEVDAADREAAIAKQALIDFIEESLA